MKLYWTKWRRTHQLQYV
nr:unnamed protein product [Callosobruchus chinensis]